MKAFFGILYMRGTLKVNMFDLTFVFIKVATLSFKQWSFSILCRFIEFDDVLIREEKWKFDKFACIRHYFEEVNANFDTMRTPSVYLAIDETLYSYREQIEIKQ